MRVEQALLLRNCTAVGTVEVAAVIFGLGVEIVVTNYYEDDNENVRLKTICLGEENLWMYPRHHHLLKGQSSLRIQLMLNLLDVKVLDVTCHLVSTTQRNC